VHIDMTQVCVKSTRAQPHAQTSMKSLSMVLVAKLYRLSKGRSTCLQRLAKNLSIHWNCLLEKAIRHLHQQAIELFVDGRQIIFLNIFGIRTTGFFVFIVTLIILVLESNL
jgi:hypothetical protein